MTSRHRAYILLSGAALFWAGNFVLARAVHAAVPPIGLAFWRWAVVGLFVVPWAWRELRAQWPVMRAHAGLMILLGMLSVGAFNTLIYVGVQTASAIDALMLISAIPAFILVLAPVILGNRLARREILGVFVSGLGVLTVLTHGHPWSMTDLFDNSGTLWILAGVLSWALYSVLLRRLPAAIFGRGLFAATVIVGLVTLLPFYLWETYGQYRPVTLSLTLLWSVAYTAFFASVLAYLAWNKGVALIGVERAGIFIHLMPAFGLLLSAFWLKEHITIADGAGLTFILVGLTISTARYTSRRVA